MMVGSHFSHVFDAPPEAAGKTLTYYSSVTAL